LQRKKQRDDVVKADLLLQAQKSEENKDLEEEIRALASRGRKEK